MSAAATRFSFSGPHPPRWSSEVARRTTWTPVWLRPGGGLPSFRDDPGAPERSIRSREGLPRPRGRRPVRTPPADDLELIVSERAVQRLAAPDAGEAWRQGKEGVSGVREEVAALRERPDSLTEGLVTQGQLRSGSVRLCERLGRAGGALVRAHASTALSEPLGAVGGGSRRTGPDRGRQGATGGRARRAGGANHAQATWTRV